ncbi:MAG: capsular polysaccharide synthesis protein [Anaeroplasmataceae bacterium]|nr:capsular polysaccharide synthesis protein [Anaeroplasmataceae bacterium]
MSFFKVLKKKNIKNLLKQYFHCHVLLYAFFVAILHGFSRKSMEITRNAINNKILKKLRSKNKKFIKNFKMTHNFENESHVLSDIIWVAWFQGEDQAPILVKKCLKSIRESFPQKRVEVITKDNYKNFIELPEYIIKKFTKGMITYTHFSDILRLALLSKYGGTWIDATVLITGEKIPEFIMNSDLFMYQILKPGLDGQPTRISSWFITAKTNHCIIELTKELLFNYWKKKKFLMDYFLIHDFFELAIEAYPEQWYKVPQISSEMPHILLLHINDEYDDVLWNNILSVSPIHKLSYKICDENKENTLYQKIVKDF